MIKIDRTIETVRNPKWDNEEHSSFTCTVKFVEFNEELPFTATPNDMYEHTQTIWNDGIAGVYGEIAQPDTE